MSKDSVLFGIILGLLVPAIVIGVIVGALYLAGKLPTKDLLSSIVILGIATNGLVARYQFKKGGERQMRGVMAITMIEVLTWFFLFLL